MSCLKSKWWSNQEPGHMPLWLPEGMTIQDFPGNGERPAKIAYVASYISTSPYDDYRKFVPIHSATMRSIVSNEAFEAAKAHLSPYLEIDPTYVRGERSKGFRWNQSLKGKKCNVELVRAPNLLGKLRSFHDKRIASYDPLRKHLHETLQRIETTVPHPEHFDSLPVGSKKDPTRRNAFYQHTIWSILNQDWGSISRDKQGRLHCLITRAPREVRSTLTIDGNDSIEVDLRNSQPYFLASLFTEISGLRQSVSAGKFYDDINEHLDSPYDLSEPTLYRRIKDTTLMMLYRKPTKKSSTYPWWEDEGNKVNTLMKATEKAFPGLNDAIAAFSKVNGWSALSRKLQSMESDVFIDKVLPRLFGNGIPACPIHDGILCPNKEDELDLVRNILKEELYQATGLQPQLKTGKAAG